MASPKKGQRKRKSAGVADIFEVSEKDLSPEPEEIQLGEPSAKVAKTRNSDALDSRQNNGRHNLNNQEQVQENKEIVTENREKGEIDWEIVDVDDICISSESEKGDTLVVKDQTLSKSAVLIIDSEDEELKTKSSTENVKNIKSTVSEVNIVEDEASSLCEETGTTTAEPEKSLDEVILVCDSSLDISKDDIALSSPQLVLNDINDIVLEDGELKETLVESDTSLTASQPLIQLSFKEKAVADTYKLKFLKFIESFVELKFEVVDETVVNIFKDANFDPKEWVVLDSTVGITDNKEVASKNETPKKKRKKKRQIPEPETEKLFVVDTKPGIQTQKNVQTKYSTKFSLDEEKVDDKDKANKKPALSSICFNCEKNHALRDCPHPKNFGKISTNRQKFQANKTKSARYHVEEDQKYAHLQPGKISSDLRKALGLKKNQLPSYVYYMRRLGYPPGWLEDAKFIASELSMFDIDGNNVRNTNQPKMIGLDPTKIIDYPGFNAPTEKDVKDEFKYHRVPPYSKQFNKDSMIEFFKKTAESQQDNFETQDMEVDCNPDGIEEDLSKNRTKLQKKQLDFSTDSDSNNDPASSLQELQKQKDSLLEEIRKSEETVPWEDTSQSSADENKAENNDKESSTKADVDMESSKTSDIKESTITTEFNCVKHSVFGTPIIKTTTPYKRLPDLPNFTKGVSPVIDFENLPNSTGKYEQMTGVLQKVRQTLKKINETKT